MAESFAIEEARRILESHSRASEITTSQEKDGWVHIGFHLRPRKPPRGFANGVKPLEPIILAFPPQYPLKAPHIALRPDFSRSIPHINPVSKYLSDHVNPCVIDEPLDVFVCNNGFACLVQRIQQWIDDVAYDSLMSNDRYWEPIRRDGIDGFLTADKDKLVALLTNATGYCFLPAFLGARNALIAGGEIFGVVDDYTPLSLSESVARIRASEAPKAICLLVWPKSSCVTDTYLPDSILSINQLEDRAKSYGCARARILIGDISTRLAKEKQTDPVAVFLIFAVRRPRPMPNAWGGSDSMIELIPYLSLLESKPILGAKGPIPHYKISNSIRPFGFRHAVSSPLLRATSGKEFPAAGRVAFIGCGSLGSKVAMHLGKAGFGDVDLLDRGKIAPHNFARMGILNSWHVAGMSKVKAVAMELGMLGHRPTYRAVDVVDELGCPGGLQLSQDTLVVVDTTASPNVHGSLCGGQLSPKTARLAQSSYFANGRIGSFLCEGHDRHPDLEDLKTAFWRWWMNASDADHAAWPTPVGYDRLHIGEGCDTVTMIMSDMSASLISSGVSEMISRLLAEPHPNQGKLAIGIVNSDLCSIRWNHVKANSSVVIPSEGPWEVRILPKLAEEIERQAKASGDLETGGYLMARVNWVVRRITLAAHLPAPPDSKHSKHGFVLGTQGAREALLAMHKSARGAFLAAGTWHSHPDGGSESPTDINTLGEIAKGFCGNPAVSLIWSPTGYKVLVQQDWPKGNG